MATITEDFEDSTFVVDITNGGNASWSRNNTSVPAGGGSWSFKAGNISHEQTSDAIVAIPEGATEFSFDFRVSSEAGWDFFRVIANPGNELLVEESGESLWVNSGPIDVTGFTSLTFRYIKDTIVSENQDTAWVDNLTFTVPDDDSGGGVASSGNSDWPYITTECMFESPEWTDISPYVQEIGIKRGVSRVDSPLLRFEAGTANLVLDNRDRRFDPTHLGSPYTAGFTQGTSEKLFVANQPQAYGVGFTMLVKSATGQTADIVAVSSRASGTTGSFTCPKPVGTVSGHQMIAVLVTDVGTVAQQTLSGGSSWGTKLATATYGSDTIQVSVWRKIAGGSEPNNYNFGQNNSSDGVAFIISIENSDTAVEPAFDFIIGTNQREYITPSVDPFGTNDLELRFVGGTWPQSFTSVNWQSPSESEGFTEWVDRQSGDFTNAALAARTLKATESGGLGTSTLVLPNRPIRIRATYPFVPTTNLVRNPSFEVGDSQWSPDNIESIIQVTDTVSRYGGSCLRVTKNGTNFLNLHGAAGTLQSGIGSGEEVTASCYIYIPEESFPHVSGFTFVGNGFESTFVAFPPAGGGWYRVEATKTLTATLSTIQLQFWTDGNLSDGQVVGFIDAVQVEVRSSASPYCDGSLPGCDWTGTAHDSSSTRPESVTFDLFRGFVDNWLVEWEADVNSIVNVPCTDGFKLLTGNRRAQVSPVGANEDTGARVDRILDSANWPEDEREIATGDVLCQETTLEGEALAELFTTADTEIGELYINEQGKVVFRNREAVLADNRAVNVQARFGDGGETTGELQYHDVVINNESEQLVNEVRITRVNGTPQTSRDLDSIEKLSGGIPQTFERDDLIMASDAEAKSYADWILYISSQPELRFESLIIRPQKYGWEQELFPQVLGRQFGDRIEISRRPVGGGDPVIREVFIRGVEHTIRPYEWETRFTLQSATKVGNFLTLGHPTLGVIGQNALTP